MMSSSVPEWQWRTIMSGLAAPLEIWQLRLIPVLSSLLQQRSTPCTSFAAVNEPSHAPDPLTYSSGHVCTNPPCQFIPAFTFPHGNLIYSPSVLTHPSSADSINSSVQALCDKGKTSGSSWSPMRGFHGLCPSVMVFHWDRGDTWTTKLSLWMPSIPPGAAELIWPRT